MRPASVRFLPLILLLIAQLAVGSAALMARVGLHSGLSPLSLAAWRLLLAAVIVLLSARFARQTRDAEPLSAGERGRLILAGICLGLHFLTWFASLEQVSVARSTLLVATSPVWTGLAGTLFLKQRLPLSFWGGLALAGIGAGGVTLLGEHSPGMTGNAPVLGDLLALAGAAAFSAYLLLVDGPQRRHGTLRTISWTYSLAAASLWAGVLFSSDQGKSVPQNTGAWLAVIGMALVPQMIGHTLLNRSLLHFPAGVVGAATLLEPVFAGALAWLLFHEPLTAGQILSASALLGGVAITLRYGKSDDGTTGP